MGWEDVPPEVPAWTETRTIEYNPACAKCRDTAGKDRAGVLDRHLCVPHLIEERKRLEFERDTWKTSASKWQASHDELTDKCMKLEARVMDLEKELVREKTIIQLQRGKGYLP